jgi:hypothetical protein
MREIHRKKPTWRTKETFGGKRCGKVHMEEKGREFDKSLLGKIHLKYLE